MTTNTTTAEPTTPTPTCPEWCQGHPLDPEGLPLHNRLVRRLDGLLEVWLEQDADAVRPEVYLQPLQGGRFTEGLLRSPEAAQLGEALREAAAISEGRSA